MRTRRKSLGVVAAMAMLIGGLLAIGPPASATGSSPSQRSVGESAEDAGPSLGAKARKKVCRSNHRGAYVCFQPYGEVFFVKDTRKDGYSAAAYWERKGDGHTGVCVNSRGAGKWKKCNYSMVDGNRIKFFAVNINTPTNSYRFWSAPQYAYT